MEVAPTTVVLAGGAKAGVLYVNNDGNAPITVQIEPFDWDQIDGKERLTPSGTLMASPPIAAIPAQGKQIVRLLTTPDADSGERSFRLVISQLPDPMKQADHSVQVLTQFNVPVFTQPATGQSAKIVWDAALDNGVLEVTARNEGTGHAKLADLQIVTPGGDAEPLGGSGLNYILAGRSRSWKASCARCGIGDTVRIRGNDEASAAKLDDSLVIRR